MGIVVLSVFKDPQQWMVTGSIKPRVNTFEVLGCGWERRTKG